MTISQVNTTEYSSFYANYLNQVSKNTTIVEELELSLEQLIQFVALIPSEKVEFRYAEGKWTLKDILQHLIDTERIFAYRALRIARKDQTPLPGFEENDYVEAAHANQRKLADLVEEFKIVRQSTIHLFKTFTEVSIAFMGTASEKPVSVRAIGYIISGHQKHHLQIFNERYLIG